MDYLRNVKGIRKLGVHGESLGGMVAGYLGKACKLDFIFCDRTFSGLHMVARYGFPKIARYPLKLFKSWTKDYSENFFQIDNYKIVSSDPLDEMINDLGSLKLGVAL